MLKKCTIYGERCSGTNYLENIIKMNFNVDITWKYGWKHFFGFNDYKDSDDVLFLCIVRDPFNWIDSLFKFKYHLANPIRADINKYLNLELTGSNFLNECSKPNLNFYEISKEVNKPTNNSLSLIQKI